MNSQIKVDRPSLTIAVLTKNEAHQIRRCLTSALFADELIVVDSASTDDTVALAQEMGAKVYVYADWQGFGVQRSRLLAHATGEYILFLDADEEITPSLKDEISSFIHNRENLIGGFSLTEVAFGRELKYAAPRKTHNRLFKREVLLGFEGAVHERPLLAVTDLPRKMFHGRLRHYSRQTIHGSLRKLTQYAMLGAAKRAERNKKGGVFRGAGSGFAIFLRLYILQRGFTGGGPGFLYCFFIALECFFRYVALEYDRDDLNFNINR